MRDINAANVRTYREGSNAGKGAIGASLSMFLLQGVDPKAGGFSKMFEKDNFWKKAGRFMRDLIEIRQKGPSIRRPLKVSKSVSVFIVDAFGIVIGL